MRRLTSGRLSIICLCLSKVDFLEWPDYWNILVYIKSEVILSETDRITIMNSIEEIKNIILNEQCPVPCQSPDVKLQLLWFLLEPGGGIMKKTYYLFNPRLQRQDNTLKFTPYDRRGEQKPRFLPVENIEELLLFRESRGQLGSIQFPGPGTGLHTFFWLLWKLHGSFMPREALFPENAHKPSSFQQNKKKRIDLAQRLLIGASFNMVKNLKYYNTRGKDSGTHNHKYRKSIVPYFRDERYCRVNGYWREYS